MHRFISLLALAGPLSFYCAFACAEEPAVPVGYHLLYATHFEAGLDASIGRQGATAGSLKVVPCPGGRPGQCLRAHMSLTDDFSKVANGAPRVELSFSKQFDLKMGRKYVVDWSTFLPPDHVFDSQQPECITQIHHGLSTGSPPFMLYMLGDHYQVFIRGGKADALTVTTLDLFSAVEDRGKWVRWRLHYLPDATGARAVLRLEREGKLVANLSGKPNAYAGDNKAHWKMGIYKWRWQRLPSDATTRTVFYGDLRVAIKD